MATTQSEVQKMDVVIAPKPCKLDEKYPADKYTLIKTDKDGKQFVFYKSIATLISSKSSRNHNDRFSLSQKKRVKQSTRKSVPKLRASITSGTVLIILKGRYRGCRVIFLKQLPKGKLLVTGPHCYNSVNLHLVSQQFVIATSTKIDISSVKLEETLKERLFIAPGPVGPKSDFDALEQGTKQLSAQQEAIRQKNIAFISRLQQDIDQQVCPIIEQVPMLKEYLGEKFSLIGGKSPHLIRF